MASWEVQVSTDQRPMLTVQSSITRSVRTLEPLTGRVCLIPVPLGTRRLRERGYNQSERIRAFLMINLSHFPCRALINCTS